MHDQPARLGRTLLVAVLALVAARAGADVAGRGTFDISLNVGIPNTTFDGTLTFDPGTQTVLGTPVDLASDVGAMSYAGTAQVSLQSRSATFEFTAGPASGLEFHASGAGSCDATGCLNGQATFGGILDSITDAMDVLPDATYTFDGTIFVSFAGGGVGGTFGINAFAPQPTPTGTGVLVASGETTFFDSTQGIVRSFSGTIRYPSVTSGGTTSFVAFSEVPGEIPQGYELAPDLSIFIDVFTSATFTGNADVCVTVADVDQDGIADGTTFPVAQLRLLHQAVSGQSFTDVTNATQPDGFLCGNVSSLSVFVLAVDPSLSGSTTTTTTPGGGTTTTTLPTCTEPVACIDAALAAPLCGEETINPKLQKVITGKLAKAKALLGKAATKPSSKVAKFVTKAGKQLSALGKKAGAFASKKKGPISSACRDGIRAVLAQIEAALAANPPTGTGGGGGGGGPIGNGVRAAISDRANFQGSGFFGRFGSVVVSGCETFSASNSTCRRTIALTFQNDPLGTPQTLTGPAAFVSYRESSSAASPQDTGWNSVGESRIEVLGLSDGRLRGRFSATLVPELDTNPNLNITGTFNVPEEASF